MEFRTHDSQTVPVNVGRTHDDPPLSPKRRLLWVGDSPTVATGFGRATKYIVDGLLPTYDVEVLGMHYRGDPHHFPYEIWPTKYDVLGARRLPERCEAFRPDVIVLQNDVWNIPYYVKALRKSGVETPVVAALAVDGKNCQSAKLDGMSLAIFWTEFAQEEARFGGWDGPSAVVPLGVDLDVYKLADASHVAPLREKARNMIETDAFDLDRFKSGFVVLNVNRNQQRKRLDLTVQFFCEWVLNKKIDDAFLMVQACPTGEQEYDVAQLMAYYGLSDRLLLIYPDMEYGVPEYMLAWTYRCADVGITTTQGEGFGLTTFEMMACGIPQIVPAWSALDEICEDAALKVPCTGNAATQGGVNVIGGVADRDKFVEALDMLYRNSGICEELTRRGLAVVQKERYRWAHIGVSFASAIDEAIFRVPMEAAWADLGRPEEVHAV